MLAICPLRVAAGRPEESGVRRAVCCVLRIRSEPTTTRDCRWPDWWQRLPLGFSATNGPASCCSASRENQSVFCSTPVTPNPGCCPQRPEKKPSLLMRSRVRYHRSYKDQAAPTTRRCSTFSSSSSTNNPSKPPPPLSTTTNSTLAPPHLSHFFNPPNQIKQCLPEERVERLPAESRRRG